MQRVIKKEGKSVGGRNVLQKVLLSNVSEDAFPDMGYRPSSISLIEFLTNY